VTNRSKGHDAERAVAKYLRDNGYPDAITTRQKLGSDGSRQPGDVDVCDGSGLVVEVKNVGRSQWPTWLSQAREQAQGRPWVLVRKTPRVTDVGKWVAAVELAVARPWTGVFTFRGPLAYYSTLTARPADWLNENRFTAWSTERVVFCSFEDAISLHRLGVNP
jgi:Holliday junction resolvase